MVLKSHESGWVLRPGNPVSDKGDSQVLGVAVLLHIYVFSGIKYCINFLISQELPLIFDF